MVWAQIFGSDGRLMLVCPAVDAELQGFLSGAYYFRFILVEERCP